MSNYRRLPHIWSLHTMLRWYCASMFTNTITHFISPLPFTSVSLSHLHHHLLHPPNLPPPTSENLPKPHASNTPKMHVHPPSKRPWGVCSRGWCCRIRQCSLGWCIFIEGCAQEGCVGCGGTYITPSSCLSLWRLRAWFLVSFDDELDTNEEARSSNISNSKLFMSLYRSLSLSQPSLQILNQTHNVNPHLPHLPLQTLISQNFQDSKCHCTPYGIPTKGIKILDTKIFEKRCKGANYIPFVSMYSIYTMIGLQYLLYCIIIHYNCGPGTTVLW